MKKRLVATLLAVMTVSVAIAGCGSSDSDEKQTTVGSEVSTEAKEEAPKIDSALEILTNTWSQYADDQKFAVGGGDAENMVMDAPGNFSISDAQMVDYMLGFPEANIADIDDCASMVHMMNANTFTGAAYHVTDSSKMADIAEAVKGNILVKEWLCGFPETLVIFKVGDYMVTAYGAGDLIETFKTNITKAYDSAELMIEQSLWTK